MYNLTEQNEIRSRRSALTLAIALHLGLAALLYLFTSEKPENPDNTTAQANVEQVHINTHGKTMERP